MNGKMRAKYFKPEQKKKTEGNIVIMYVLMRKMKTF